MAETSLYVPVLRSKLGEYAALASLAYSCRRIITPLIDIIPPATKKEESGQGRTLSDQMKHHGTFIKRSWNLVGAPIFIDCRFMPTADDGNALRLLFAHLTNHRAIPVFGPGRSESYRATVIQLAKAKPSDGACYRIPKGFLFDTNLNSMLDGFSQEADLPPASIDMILDLEELLFPYVDESALIDRINSLPRLREWRSLTVTAGSFPLTLTGMTVQTRPFRRYDWLTWNRLIESNKLKRSPIYGDYGIQNPSTKPAPHLGKANIRYTTADSWLVFRGSEMIKRGSETRDYAPQMKPLCRLVCANDAFCNSDYSMGDQYMYEVANDETAPSNDATKWKAVAFSHHLTYVSRQIIGRSAA